MNSIDYSYGTIHLVLAHIQYMYYKNVVSVDSWVMKWYTELSLYTLYILIHNVYIVFP